MIKTNTCTIELPIRDIDEAILGEWSLTLDASLRDRRAKILLNLAPIFINLRDISERDLTDIKNVIFDEKLRRATVRRNTVKQILSMDEDTCYKVLFNDSVGVNTSNSSVESTNSNVSVASNVSTTIKSIEEIGLILKEMIIKK